MPRVTRSLVLFALAATASAQGNCLTTLFASNNQGSPGGNVYFDITVTNPNGVTITGFEVNTMATGVSIDMNVWITPTSANGNQTNAAVWTQVSTGTGTAMGQDVPSTIDTVDFNLPPGSYGMALESGAGIWQHTYTNGSNAFGNGDIALSLGSATNVPFNAPVFEPRTWNGTICYQPGVAECWLLVGAAPTSAPLGPLLPALATNQDVLLVDPLLIVPMDLANQPTVPIPANAPLGASVYTQAFLLNPWTFPNDPIKLSQALEWQLGAATTVYGTPSGLLLSSTSPPTVLPGETLTMTFTIL